MAENKEVRITRLITHTIPMFGNHHYMPYFVAEVTDGKHTQICKSKGDTLEEHSPYQYVTFRRKRYKVINIGSLYKPNYQLKEVDIK